MTNNSLLKVNGSEEKVYKVEVLKLGKRVESHFRLGGAFEYNFFPEGKKVPINTKTRIIQLLFH